MSDFEADGIYGYMPKANDQDLLAAETMKKTLIIVVLLLQHSQLALLLPGEFACIQKFSDSYS